MQHPSTIRYTYTDYLSTPEDTSRRYEIVDGDLFVTASPRFRHQVVVGNILRLLGALADANGLGTVVAGPLTVHLHDELVVEPDVLFIRADRMGIVGSDGRVHGPPDLVVEVLSPPNRDYDRNLKRKHYLENGVGELWTVDADAGTLEVWTPDAVQPAAARDVVEWQVAGRRFEIPLAAVFRA